jgi:predicted TIM-barrel fold metal-dependent hydrolase
LANDNYLRHSKATLKDRPLPDLPSRMFARHFHYTVAHDPYGIANRDRIGVERLMWSTELGPETTPDEVAESVEELAPIPAKERRLVAAANAARVFRHGGQA